MGQSNYRSRWQPRFPHVRGAAAAGNANPNNIKTFDRVLPAVQLHLAPVFASSFSLQASFKSMAAYGRRVRGPLSFSVFRDGDGEPGDRHEEVQNHARLQKRPPAEDRLCERPPKPAAPRSTPSTPFPFAHNTSTSSTSSDDPVKLPPTAAHRPPCDPNAHALLGASPPSSPETVCWSRQPLSSQPGRTAGLNSHSVSRHARSKSENTNKPAGYRLSLALEPVDARFWHRPTSTLSPTLSAPASPTLSLITCHRTRLSSPATGNVSPELDSRSGPLPSTNSSDSLAGRPSLSDRTNTFTETGSSVQQPAATVTDTTSTNASSVALEQNFASRTRPFKNRMANQNEDNIMGDSPAKSSSSSNLLRRLNGVLAEKTTNLKRVRPFGLSTAPKKPQISAPYDVRRETTPPRRPNPGEGQREWGVPELINQQPTIPADVPDETSQGQQPVQRSSMEITPASLKDTEASFGSNETVTNATSPSFTALPSQPHRTPASRGLRSMVPKIPNRMSKLALNDQYSPNASAANEPTDEKNLSRTEKQSVFQRIKDTLNLTRRHRRRNTAVQSAMDLQAINDHNSPVIQPHLRASQSAVLLPSHGLHGRARQSMLPPIEVGPEMTFSGMNLLPDTDATSRESVVRRSIASPPPAPDNSAATHGDHNQMEFPAFARDPHIPASVTTAGHNGFHLMQPLHSHEDVMEFIEAPNTMESANNDGEKGSASEGILGDQITADNATNAACPT